MGPSYNFELEIENISIGIILYVDPTKHFIGSQHQHSGYELHFFNEGEAQISVNGADYAMLPNRGYFIANNTFHKTSTVSETMRRASLLFSLKKVDKNETSEYDKYIDLFKTLPQFLEFEVPENLNALFNLILSYLLSPFSKPINMHYIKSLCTLIFIELFRCLFPESEGIKAADENSKLITSLSDESKQNIILAYFSNNLATATLKDLSEILHLSTRQVSRFLAEKMNDSFSELLKKHRIEHAKSLIASNSHTLDEIAYLCGYNTYKGFYLSFSKYTGMNPLAFKESLTKKKK